MKIEEMAEQVSATGDCLKSFAKVMKVIETRDAEQLAAVLKAFLENDDFGNTSFARPSRCRSLRRASRGKTVRKPAHQRPGSSVTPWNGSYIQSG